MKPAEFLVLAEQLANGATEAELRTAVSRAYYCAFHEAASFLQACGVQVQATAEAHTKVAFCLKHSADIDVVNAAVRLVALRKARNDADYQLDSTRFQPTWVLSHIADCKAVVHTLHSADLSVIGPSIRDYAKNVLRLIVTHP